MKSKWGGAYEYLVPGAKVPGETRILVKCFPSTKKCIYGWTTNHYWQIYEFTNLPDVPGGSPS